MLIPRMYATTQKKLPTELDVKTKRTRRKYYFLDSVAFAAVFLMLTIADALFVQKQWDVINVFPHLSHPVNVVVTLAFEFFLGVIVFYIISYIWGEWLIKIYNRKLEKLDKDE